MIAEEQLQELYQLYDRFHGALDPLALEVLEAERAFFQELDSFHSTPAPEIPFHEFRRQAIRKCKEYLRKS